MADNPYQSLTAESDGALPPGSPPKLRTGVAIFAATAWNAPIVAVFYLLFTDAISVRTMDWLLLAWSATIPVVSLLVAYIAPRQGILYKPDVDMGVLRPKLWGLAILWSILTGIGATMTLFVG